MLTQSDNKDSPPSSPSVSYISKGKQRRYLELDNEKITVDNAAQVKFVIYLEATFWKYCTLLDEVSLANFFDDSPNEKRNEYFVTFMI